MRTLPLVLVLPFALAACGGGKQEQAAAPADSTALAMEQYNPAAFDTITWTADSAQTNRGDVVWNFSCKKCHGQLGHGDGDALKEMAQMGDTLTPPNFATNWRFGSDREALIKAIYAGSNKGMPHWGISGLKPRDIDAVAAFVTKNLVGINDMTVQTSK